MYSVSYAKIHTGGGDWMGYLEQSYAQGDYYSQDYKTVGKWQGDLAEELGLSGEVNIDDLESLGLGEPPEGMEHIEEVPTNKTGDRVATHDFTFSAPKSVSIASFVDGDKRLIDAHEKAVATALKELEKLSGWRADNAQRFEQTGKLAIAKFTHETSRALDPQLHTHAVAMNMTVITEKDKDGNEVKKLRGLDVEGMYKNMQYVSSIYQNELAKSCMDLGYDIRLNKNDKGYTVGFELNHISKKEIEHFSKRSAQIKEKLDELRKEYGDNLSREQIKITTIETRDGKVKINLDELIAEWKEASKKVRESLSEDELNVYLKIEKEIDGFSGHGGMSNGIERGSNIDQEKKDLTELTEIVSEIINERNATFTENDLLAQSIMQGIGHHSFEKIKEIIQNNKNLISLDKDAFGVSHMTRQDYYLLEKQSLVHLFEQRNSCTPFCRNQNFEIDQKVQGDARNVIEGILKSKDGMIFVEGTAGAGKTFMLTELTGMIKELEKHMSSFDKEIIGLAPSAKAVKEMQSVGIDSQTIHSLLVNPNEQKKIHADSVLIVDESSFIGQRLGTKLEKLQKDTGCRIIFIGDTKQLKSVDAGEYIRNLKDKGNIQRFTMDKTRRANTHEKRQAVDSFREDAEMGFEALEALGAFVETEKYIEEGAKEAIALLKEAEKLRVEIEKIPKDQRTEDQKKLLKDIEEGNYCGVIADRNSEVDQLNSIIREEFIDKSTEFSTTVFESDSSFTEAEARHLININTGDKFFNAKDSEVLTVVNKPINGDGGIWLQSSNGNTFKAENLEGFQKIKEKEIKLAVGDVVQITTNFKSDKKAIEAGFSQKCENGDKGTLIDVSKDTYTIKTFDGRHIENQKDCKFVKNAFAGSAHSWQGGTVRNTIASSESPINKKSAFVSGSRDKESLQIFTPDKLGYKHAVMQRDGVEKLAHEVVGGSLVKDRVQTIQRTSKIMTERAKREAEKSKKKNPNKHRKQRRTRGIDKRRENLARGKWKLPDFNRKQGKSIKRSPEQVKKIKQLVKRNKGKQWAKANPEKVQQYKQKKRSQSLAKKPAKKMSPAIQKVLAKAGHKPAKKKAPSFAKKPSPTRLRSNKLKDLAKKQEKQMKRNISKTRQGLNQKTMKAMNRPSRAVVKTMPKSLNHTRVMGLKR